jgi:hypothetical protein
MPADYMGSTDSQMLNWMSTFASKLSASPATYMASVAEAAGIQSAVDAYAAAYADAIDPEQRTPVVVAIKDDARNAAAQLCRQYANLIKYNAGISDPDKIAAGIRPVNPNRDPISCPQTQVKLNIVAATFGTHTLQFADSLTQESGAKAFGATEVQLFIAVADAPVEDPEAARFYNKFTRNPIAVAFDHADNTKQATYFARWAGRRGDVGPWSNPVSLAIAA